MKRKCNAFSINLRAVGSQSARLWAKHKGCSSFVPPLFSLLLCRIKTFISRALVCGRMGVRRCGFAWESVSPLPIRLPLQSDKDDCWFVFTGRSLVWRVWGGAGETSLLQQCVPYHESEGQRASGEWYHVKKDIEIPLWQWNITWHMRVSAPIQPR